MKRPSLPIRVAAALAVTGGLLGAYVVDRGDGAGVDRFCDLMADVDHAARVAYAGLPDEPPHAEIVRMRAAFFAAHEAQFEAISAAAPIEVADEVALLVSGMKARVDRQAPDQDLTTAELSAQEAVVEFHRESCGGTTQSAPR